MKKAWAWFRGLPRWAQITGWVVLAIIVIGSLAPAPDDDDQTVASDTTTTEAPAQAETTAAPATAAPTTAAPTTAAPTTAAGPKTRFGDGQYRVGTDIAPGTYVAPGGRACYWERQATFGGGSLGDIIANDLSSGGQVVVTIAASDVGFETDGCGTWAPG